MENDRARPARISPLASSFSRRREANVPPNKILHAPERRERHLPYSPGHRRGGNVAFPPFVVIRKGGNVTFPLLVGAGEEGTRHSLLSGRRESRERGVPPFQILGRVGNAVFPLLPRPGKEGT